MINSTKKRSDALTLLKKSVAAKLALNEMPEALRPYVTLDQLKLIYTALLKGIKNHPEQFTNISTHNALRLPRKHFGFAKNVQVLKDESGQYCVVLETNAKNSNKETIQTDLLGEGTYKTVKKAFRIDSKAPILYAHSKLKAGFFENEETFINRINPEIEVSKLFESPHIARYSHGAIYKNGRKGSVFSFCGQGTLTEVIENKILLDIQTKQELFQKIILAVAHMNERGYAHQDIKSDNIVLIPSHEGVDPKIIDFGFTRRIDADEEPLASCFYASPEILQHYAQNPLESRFKYFHGHNTLGNQSFVADFESASSNLYAKPSEYNDAWSLGIIGLDLFNLYESTTLANLKDLEATHPMLFHLLQPNRSDRLTAQQVAERYLMEESAERINGKSKRLDTAMPEPHENLKKKPHTEDDSLSPSIDKVELPTLVSFRKPGGA